MKRRERESRKKLALDTTDVCGSNVGVGVDAGRPAFQSIVKTTSVYVTRAHLSTGSQNIVGVGSRPFGAAARKEKASREPPG